MCIKSINKIKAHPLNFRLFAKLCEENEQTFNQLVLHTEGRCLSTCDSLQRLVDLHNSTVEHLMNVDPAIRDEVRQCNNSLFYLEDLHSKFNEVLKRLHGKNVTITLARTITLCFQSKMEVFISSLARNDLKYFYN